MMRLNAKAFALTVGLLWSGGLFLVILVSMMLTGYGSVFLAVVDSIYPGYHRGSGVGLIIGPLYALVDGVVAGYIFAWIYNRFSGQGTNE